MYYTYIVRCRDGSLYTGITKDLRRRMHEHCHRTAACAKYTRSHPVVALEAVWRSETRSDASALEAFLKSLPRPQKLALIAAPDTLTVRCGPRLHTQNYTPLPDCTLESCLSAAASEEAQPPPAERSDSTERAATAENL
mgnify:FL=1